MASTVSSGSQLESVAHHDGENMAECAAAGHTGSAVGRGRRLVLAQLPFVRHPRASVHGMVPTSM